MSFHLGHAPRRLNTSDLSGVCFSFIKYSFSNFLSGLRCCARDLLSKEVPIEWGDAQEKSFQDLKQAQLSPPVLRFPDVSRPFHLQCDASLGGLSYVLGQTGEDGRKYVVSYGGRGLRPCEKSGQLHNWNVSAY